MPSRRNFLTALTAATVSQAQTARRPNVLLLLADDLGMECLGCYGGTSYRTPNLDRLAARGIRFTHAYAQPLCTPTRVQLMTGQHNFRNWRGFGIIDPREKTFGHMMQKAGYRTAIAGKWQFYSYETKGSSRYEAGMKPEDGGFSEYLLWHALHTETKGSRYADPVLLHNGRTVAGTKGRYGPDLEVEFLKRFMTDAGQDPFFAYHSMTLTHDPFTLTPRSGKWEAGDRLRSDADNFRDMVEYMDYTVGSLVDFLDESGLWSNTLVLFYSDNGTHTEITSEWNGKHVRGGKGQTTEAGMHVPLIAAGAGVYGRGRICSDLIDSTDFVPTIAEATGATWFANQPMDGRSFAPQLRGRNGRPREAAFAHYDPHPGQRVNFPPTRLAWDHRHKLYMDGRLYNIVRDDLEQSPIPPDEPSSRSPRKKLQAVLDQMAQVAAPVFNRYDADAEPSPSVR